VDLKKSDKQDSGRGARASEPSQRQQKELLRVTLASIGDAVITTDAGGRITALNRVAESLTGWTEKEAMGRPLGDVFRVVNEETGEALENPVERVLRLGIRAGLANHSAVIAKDGTRTPIDDSAAPIQEGDGPIHGVVLVFRDVREQRAAERARARLAAIVEHSGDAIFTKDLNGVVQIWNISAERLFGYRADEIVGKSVTLLIPPERLHEEPRILASLRAGKPVERLETIRVTKDGRRIPVQISVSPLRDRDGRVIGASKIVHDNTEVVAAREALLSEKEILRTTLLSIGDGVIVTDSQGRVSFLNPEAQRLTGWKEDEARGQELPSVFRIINEETGLPAENPVEKVLRLGMVVGLANHTLLIDKSGREIPIDDSAAPIRRSGGELFGVVLVFRDFTARRRAELRLRQASDQFRSVVDHVVDGIISIDESGKVLSFNPAAEKIFGYASEEVVGRNVAMLMPSPYRDEHDGYLASYRRTLQPKVIGIGREVEGRRKDGTTFPMELGVSEFVVDSARRFTGIVRDITERKLAEHALRESEQRFRMMADAAPVLIWVSGTDRLFTWLNKPWLEFVGRPMEKELGNGWTENVHSEDLDGCLATYTRSFEAREPFSMVYRLRRHDGVYRWLLDNGIPRYGSGGEFAGYIGSCVDITEQQRTEEALMEADRRKNQFLAILSHELRNPLAPIGMAATMLEKLAPPDPNLKELRDIITRQTKQLSRLLDDLLDVGRITSGKIVLRRERTSLGLAVSSAVESVRPLIEAQGHQLNVNGPGESISVDGDIARLSQVIANLLSNAAKYTERGGRIDLTLRREDGHAVVSVKDSGIGISPEQMSSIFDLFAQASLERGQGGLGVGLALSKTLVELHGGSLEAHSEGLGKGSEFVVRLPALPMEGTSPREIDKSASTAASVQRRILIADDNVDSATALSVALRHEGHDVVMTHDGAETLEKAKLIRPELALLDIGMPKVNGYEVARELRALFGDAITLVAITGWGQVEDRQRATEAGFDHHLTKPVDLVAIQRLIESSFRQAPPPHRTKPSRHSASPG
jgi:PAS domain S-box-containing protein